MGTECGDATTPATLQCFITTTFPNIIHAAVLFIGVLVLFLVATIGFRFITAHNDPKQLEAAKHMLLWAFLGMGIVLFSVLAINVMATALNIPCLAFFSFTSCQ